MFKTKRKLRQELIAANRGRDWLHEKLGDEREKVAGYEQIAKVHSAYITILLNKLGATKDNMITITAEEVREALKKYEARAMPAEEGYSLYCEVIE